jgi:hypothetical protein
MGLAASMSYSSSRSGGPGSFPQSRTAQHPSLDTVLGGISPEDPTPDDDASPEPGLSTIRESSRSSSTADLRTPRVLASRQLAGKPEDEDPDLSPRNASGGAPSGLSLMLSRSEASPRKGGASPGRGGLAEGGGTDELASGGSGLVGVLDVPKVDEKTGMSFSYVRGLGLIS